MFQRTYVLAVVSIALGGLLGYAEASGQFAVVKRAHAPAQSIESNPIETQC